jgi:rhodanese-related sulfurtransferase
MGKGQKTATATQEEAMNEAGGVERVRPNEIDSTTMPILDARRHPGKEQIRGALRYDERALLSEERLTLPLPHEGRIVVYADSDDDAQRVAARLREQGYEQAAVLDGGFDAYREAGLPTEEITQEQPIPGHEGTGIPRG